VDPKAVNRFSLVGFNMNIRGAFFNRSKNNRVHESDDRSFISCGIKNIDRAFKIKVLLEFFILNGVYQISVGLLINTVNGILDTKGSSTDDLDLFFIDHVKIIHHIEVEWVTHQYSD